MPEFLTDFPSNILTEILSRLPLRTLFVAHCVCKTFLHLGSPKNPLFITLHSANASRVLIFQFRETFWPLRRTYLLDPEADLKNFQATTWRTPEMGASIFQLPGHYYTLANACNGLIYFVLRHHDFDEDSIVCNPVTNEYLMIPNEDGKTAATLLLGFSSISNQYKILKISNCYGTSIQNAKVLDIASNLWRDVIEGRIPPWYDEPLNSPSYAFLDGIIYRVDDDSDKVMDFFDFDNEVFGAIELPSIISDYKDSIFAMSKCVGILGGFLYFSAFDHSTRCMVLWTMKNDNSRASWSTKYVFNLDPRDPFPFRIRPVQILMNGEILMVSSKGDTILCYDRRIMKDLKYVFHKPVNVDFVIQTLFVEVVPSFVPLKDELKVEGNVILNDNRGYEADDEDDFTRYLRVFEIGDRSQLIRFFGVNQDLPRKCTLRRDFFIFVKQYRLLHIVSRFNKFFDEHCCSSCT